VILGVIVSALFFSWSHAKKINIKISYNRDDWKIYGLQGTLFFASVKNFHELFSVQEDPDNVIIDFESVRVVDHSAIMLIDNLANKYKSLGKNLHLINLNSDCLKILESAKDMIQVNLLDTVKAARLLAEDKSKRNAQLALRLKQSKIF
jgi:SulP family sulfate permease